MFFFLLSGEREGGMFGGSFALGGGGARGGVRAGAPDNSCVRRGGTTPQFDGENEQKKNETIKTFTTRGVGGSPPPLWAVLEQCIFTKPVRSQKSSLSTILLFTAFVTPSWKVYSMG